MADAITRATELVATFAKFKKVLATRGVERFVFELGESLTDAGIQDSDQADIFLRLSSEARQVFETIEGAN